jgi:hypothetical protein
MKLVPKILIYPTSGYIMKIIENTKGNTFPPNSENPTLHEIWHIKSPFPTLKLKNTKKEINKVQCGMYLKECDLSVLENYIIPFWGNVTFGRCGDSTWEFNLTPQTSILTPTSCTLHGI